MDASHARGLLAAVAVNPGSFTEGQVFAREVMRCLAEPVALVWPNGRLLHANAAFTALATRLGHPWVADGCPIAELLGPAAADVVAGCVDRAAAVTDMACGGASELALCAVPLLQADRAVALMAVIARERGGDGGPEASASQGHLVGQLAAGVAHEIRNPLTAISGFLQLLAPLCAEGPAARYVRVVGEEIARLERVAGDLLLLSPSRRPARGPCDLGDCIRTVAEVVSPRAEARGVRVRLSIAPELPPVAADPERVEQVLLNLMGNAVEAMSGQGCVEVGARAWSSAFSAVSVVDDGPGIPADILPRVFDPFFTTKAGGTGLGLAVSESIVRSFGGSIDVESLPGRGATFCVRLPVGARCPAPP